jgi:hypothetical protein
MKRPPGIHRGQRGIAPYRSNKMKTRNDIQKALHSAESIAFEIESNGKAVKSELVKRANEEMAAFLEEMDIEAHRSESEVMAAAGFLALLSKGEREEIHGMGGEGQYHDPQAKRDGAKPSGALFNDWLRKALPGEMVEKAGGAKECFKGGGKQPRVLKMIGQGMICDPNNFRALEVIVGDLRTGSGTAAAARLASKAPEVSVWLRENWASRAQRWAQFKPDSLKKEGALAAMVAAAKRCKKHGVSLDDARVAFAEGFETSPAASEESRKKAAAAAESAAADIAADFVEAIAAEQEEAAAEMK